MRNIYAGLCPYVIKSDIKWMVRDELMLLVDSETISILFTQRNGLQCIKHVPEMGTTKEQRIFLL